MKISRNILMKSLKGITITTLTGFCALVGSQGLIAHEMNTSTTINANYNISDLYNTINRSIPKGYVKANYKVVLNQDIDRFTHDGAAKRATDLSMEEAAEIIAQEVYRVYQLNLNNQTIEMAYSGANDNESAIWTGHIQYGKRDEIYFNIKADTGEIYSFIRELKSDLKVVSEKESDQIADESMAKAEEEIQKDIPGSEERVKELLVKAGIIAEGIQSVKYETTTASVPADNGQPLSPIVNHSFNVTTLSGQVYNVDVSTDLTSIDCFTTPAFIKASEAIIKELMQH